MDNSAIKNEQWSFSKINTYENCPKCFYLTYIQKFRKSSNAFSQFGTWCHKLLEMYFKGEAEFFELSQLYEDGYSNHVKKKFPKSFNVDLSELYYQDGKKYFDAFEGLSDDYKVLGTEQKINLEIQGYKFIGYIDLILENSGNIILVDHKSRNKFNSRNLAEQYFRQLYLYSIYIQNKYKKDPSKLVFNLFRKDELIEIPFNKSKQKEAIDWVLQTIAKISRDRNFEDKIFLNYQRKNKDISKFKKNDFFCNELCSMKRYCERSKYYKQKE